MKRYILLITLMLMAGTLLAQQAHFTTSGIIEYEKKANMYALMKKLMNKDNESYLRPALEAYQRNNSQFKKMNSKLTFTRSKTLFTPLPDESTGNNFFGTNILVAQNNTIYTDFSNGISTTQKNVFDDLFLVKDTVRKITWKITDETREIAGYPCRRANALVMDSIYVVAFYSDKIPVSGGPESFTGLPGMILGLALPHENVTWFATKVTDVQVPESEVKPPTKGKPVNNKQLRTTLESAIKSWGTYAQPLFKAYLL